MCAAMEPDASAACCWWCSPRNARGEDRKSWAVGLLAWTGWGWEVCGRRRVRRRFAGEVEGHSYVILSSM